VLRRVLAFTELKFWTSMIEAWCAPSNINGCSSTRWTAFRRSGTRGVLRPGTQPGASPFGVSRTDTGRNVLRQRGRGSSRPGGTCGRRRRARAAANRSAACGTCPSIGAAA
jgi:hypothetical protein